MENIKYLFTSGGDGSKRGKGTGTNLSGILASKSGPELAASALVSKPLSSLWPTWCVSFYHKTTDPRVSKAIDVWYGKIFNA